MDKEWVFKKPDLPAQPVSGLLTDEAGRQYKADVKICRDCGKGFESRTYYFANGWVWKNNRVGACKECCIKRAEVEDNLERAKLKAETDAKRETWRKSCGIPRDYLFKGFQHFEQDWQPKAYSLCLDYATNFPISNPHGFESLVLFSDHSWGTGKTMLACAIAHRILSRWNGETGICPVVFISEPRLFLSITATYNYTHEEQGRLDSEQQIINRLVKTPLLILDDLGKQEVSDLRFVQRTLFAIFDGRYNEGLPVVVTSNLNDAGLKVHMGGNAGNEASFSRLREMCRGKFVPMDGKDYREKLAGER